jgi:hypothetical protein
MVANVGRADESRLRRTSSNFHRGIPSARRSHQARPHGGEGGAAQLRRPRPRPVPARPLSRKWPVPFSTRETQWRVRVGSTRNTVECSANEVVETLWTGLELVSPVPTGPWAEQPVEVSIVRLRELGSQSGDYVVGDRPHVAFGGLGREATGERLQVKRAPTFEDRRCFSDREDPVRPVFVSQSSTMLAKERLAAWVFWD